MSFLGLDPDKLFPSGDNGRLGGCGVGERANSRAARARIFGLRIKEKNAQTLKNAFPGGNGGVDSGNAGKLVNSRAARARFSGSRFQV
jgi:hypothetical protein